jgi:hypothetical protein
VVKLDSASRLDLRTGAVERPVARLIAAARGGELATTPAP